MRRGIVSALLVAVATAGLVSVGSPAPAAVSSNCNNPVYHGNAVTVKCKARQDKTQFSASVKCYAPASGGHSSRFYGDWTVLPGTAWASCPIGWNIDTNKITVMTNER